MRLACAPSLSHYLAAGEPIGTFIASPTPIQFRLDSFDAATLFGPAGCLGCDDQGDVIPSPSFIRVTGLLFGGIVGQQEFALTHSFQTFTVTQPGFRQLGRLVFQGLDANHQPLEGYYAVDNINVTAVPEPASLALIGSGLAAFAARRRRAKVRR